MRRRFFVMGLGVAACGTALGLAGLRAQSNSQQQSILVGSPAFPAEAATHETRTELPMASGVSSASEKPAQGEFEIPRPTRSTFMASWASVDRALGYLLDVSTNDSFSSYLDGYHDLDVGNATARVVTGLNGGTTYYYRVRPYGVTGPGAYSSAMKTVTETTTGLNINPTFDSSITNNPNAAAIEAMINRAISIYESLFTDPITIQIRYRYATTGPDGHPLSQTTVSRSDFVIYPIPWSVFISSLTADAKTGNDNLANASLPGNALSPTIKPASANGRAVGLDTPPAMFANGTVSNGPYDGIVTLNSAIPFQFSRPTNSGNFDAQRATEHETDEVIGFASAASSSNLHPQDVFSWSSAGVRNISSNGARYFSINGGVTNIVNFNQNSNADLGDWLSAPCPQTLPYVQNALGCSGQSSDIAATSPEGINLDVIGYDLVQTSLGNISTRGFVQTGENVMIGGFIVQGTGPKTVIIRAIGPELSQHGIANPLADPTLELHNGAGTLIAFNDNWQTTVLGGIITANQVGDIQNSGHAPTAPSESAIIANLPPGNYTAIVRGINNATGVALVEAYDLSPNNGSILGNISTRDFVQTGENVMIGGFIVQGAGQKRVIIRAIGPELSQHGIANPLADPTLELHNEAGTLIAFNDNWQTTIVGGIITANQVSDIQNSGHAPSASSESAIIANLPPGNYTAIVRGVNNTTGVALVEVYDLN